MTQADWIITARDGLLLAVVGSAYVMALLRLNPRLFLKHFPPEIRAAAPPTTRGERRLGRVAGLPLGLLLVGWPIWSSLQLAARHPDAGPLALGLNAVAVFMAFNLVDFVVLDLFWIGWLKPSWAMIPGTEEVVFKPHWRYDLMGFGIGAVVAVVIGVLAIGAARWLA